MIKRHLFSCLAGNHSVAATGLCHVSIRWQNKLTIGQGHPQSKVTKVISIISKRSVHKYTLYCTARRTRVLICRCNVPCNKGCNFASSIPNISSTFKIDQAVLPRIDEENDRIFAKILGKHVLMRHSEQHTSN